MNETIFKTTYETVGDYLPRAKRNDILVFDGKGIMSGFNSAEYKFDTYKLIEADQNRLKIRQYRARNVSRLPSCNYDQCVAVLSKKEFNQLKNPG